ncbi:hypothetical protein MSG28_011368 [Choristoneura fumiferana]|uniref:Uncharacterized protein n=1 Tax=Choristoneura fumiferana TaxID=7141 RepID=A0ACC0JN79_CHOFU|nr:hypothetical protein MSG28_011368 [Choristoneura fumiferana]
MPLSSMLISGKLETGWKGEGAKKLVEHLHSKGVPIALATSSSKESVDLKMKNFPEFLGLFQHLTMGSTDPEVTKGKPDPAIFLVCASRFSDKPKAEDCLVFEDAVNGMKAAINANMQVGLFRPSHTS